MRSCVRSTIAVVSVLLVCASAHAQVSKEEFPGITNFARVETAVACGGAVTPEAIADLKSMGFSSVINLRLADEPGAEIIAEAAAAKAAGMNFIHIPFSAESPDPAVVDAFLKAVTAPANVPAFVHCSSGNRAAAMWFVKRVLVDGWTEDRAAAEAADLGLTSSGLKQFVLNYVRTHKK